MTEYISEILAVILFGDFALDYVGLGKGISHPKPTHTQNKK